MSTKPLPKAPAARLDTGRTRQKQRTRGHLLEAARNLIASGGQPTVTETADAAGISRRTAYRYFPSQQKLLTEAALEGTRPAIESALAEAPAGASGADIEERVRIFVRTIQRLGLEHEALLRTMVQLTVLEPTQPGLRPRGGRRIEWVELAVQPLKRRLSRAAWDRLVSGLALCVGIEAIMVLHDIRGMSPARAVRQSEWMALALVRQALADSGTGPAER
jgi:AcrR family transcriptional regulator